MRVASAGGNDRGHRPPSWRAGEDAPSPVFRPAQLADWAASAEV